jgi:superfamily II DNA/RNA helicase
VRTFAKPLDLSVVAAYGGSGVKEQINGLKRGAHVVVCTPGRMIDILVTSNGSVTNLRRVQMLVIDEADRMFDMGFEPQISRIVGQVLLSFLLFHIYLQQCLRDCVASLHPELFHLAGKCRRKQRNLLINATERLFHSLVYAV